MEVVEEKNEEDFTVKALVDFYDTLEAVKCLPPDIRKARTIARIEAERVSRLQKQWKELSEKVFNSRPRESLIAFPVPEGHVQSLRDTINSYSQPNSPNPSHTINTTPIKKKVLKVSRTSDDFRDFTSSPAFTGNVRDDSRTGLSSLDMIVPEEAEEEKKEEKKTTILIVRHGERIDHIDEKWISLAQRPFDPGLSTRGMQQAREVGEKLKKGWGNY